MRLPDPIFLSCEQEPIHVPGAIQPHGALVAALVDGLLVTHASANLAAIFGCQAAAVLGRPLAAVIGEAACRALLAEIPSDGSAVGHAGTLTGPDGSPVGLRVYRSGRHICIDIEPNRPGPLHRSPIILAQTVLETFRHTTTRRELCELAVTGLRAITGYDRVMAYRFHEDGHGEVIAEARAVGLEPYLGLHYPAADVPAQVRRLYLRQRVGAIADASYQPVPLLVDPGLDDGTPLDLTHSSLRSASPVHCEYMRNMKTAASLTIGLAQREAPIGHELREAKLWGMLVCHHTTPRVARPEIRAVADMVGQLVSLLLGSLGETEQYAERFKRDATLRGLVDRFAEPGSLAAAFVAAEAQLLTLVDAGGAVVCISGTQITLGVTPPPGAVADALSVLRSMAGREVLAVDDLGVRHPALSDCLAEGSGALLLPFSQDPDNVILWFRPEVARVVAWGGNPSEHATADAVTGRLSPRNSFAAWKEAVRGRSAPWAEIDLAVARELRSAIEAAMTLRTEAALATLRHYDPLTGLPNRSLVQDRLKAAATDGGAALLFLDLDRFKAVNDTMGHAAGDALLVEVARRLLAVAGPDDMPARLGGDEFVVLCEGRDRDAVGELCEQVRMAIEAPFEIAGRACHVAASIGIAMNDPSSGVDLMRAADMAMYAAKRGGGNRGVVYDPSLFDRATRHQQLEQEMREALSQGDQFTLLYQPEFRIAGGRRKLIGFEALVRWRHPRHGWMSPNQFIPLAEKSGLMLPLGNWILTTALHQGLALQRVRPDLGLQMAVNVSASQVLLDGFCQELAGVLEAAGFPPSALCLEVADGIMTDTVAISVLAAVRALGVHVAIDDFGVGYCSLPYLRRLPVDIVKLDRNFLVDIDGDTGGGGFVGAVVALAHAAGIQVAFEGVDTQVQSDVAVAAAADIVQGFFFAPPLSATAADDFVVQHREIEDRHSAVSPLSG